MNSEAEIDLPSKIYSIAKALTSLEPDEKHYFFEAGANDGLTQNNTIDLEPLGWQGLLVEPSPKAYQKLSKNRPNSWLFNCAIGENKDMFITGNFAEGALTGSCKSDAKRNTMTSSLRNIYSFLRHVIQFGSTPKREQLIKVPMNTISDLISQCGANRIDIMIIDLEGFELAALKGMIEGPLPRILIVETRKSNAFDINNLLLSNRFTLQRNISNFNKQKNPGWDGTHQDYLWVSTEDTNAIEACHSAHYLR